MTRRLALVALAVAAGSLPGPAADPPGIDRYGDPLPTGAVARLGSTKLRGGGNGFDLTPDGKTVFTAGNVRWVDGGEVRVWDVATGKLLRSFDHRWARIVRVSPDGKRVAVLGGGNLSYWDLAGGRMLWGDNTSRAGRNLSTITISPDGKLVAAGDRNLTLLDADTGAEVRTIERRPESNRVGAIAFSPDGILVAVEDKYELRLWEVATGQLVRTMDGQVTVNGLAFTPDGKQLLASLWDNKAKGVPVWDVATGKRVRTLAGHDGVMTAAVAVSPDGRWAATAGGPSVNSADRTSGPDHDTHIYDLATGERRHVLPGWYQAASGLRFTADSKTLATGDEVIRFWDVATGKQLRVQEGHESFVADLRFDGDTLVTAGLDGTVRGWKPRTGEQLWVKKTGPKRPTKVVLDPAGRRVCAVLPVGEAVVTEVATGAELGRVAAGLGDIRFTPSGDALLVAGSADFKRLPFGRPVETVGNYPGGSMGSSGLSQDGTTTWRIVSAAPKAAADDRAAWLEGPKPPYDLVLWDVAAGKETRRFRLPENSTWSGRPVWSPDGRQLAFGNHGLTVWDLTRSEKRAAFWRVSVLDSEPAWSPDGRRIAFTQDEKIICWDLAAGKPAFRLELGPARSYRLRWSPDGKLLAATTATTVLVYEVPNVP